MLLSTLFQKFVHQIVWDGLTNVNLAQHLTNGCYGIGDFAGQNRINTGEGIRYALDSAVLLAGRLLKEK